MKLRNLMFGGILCSGVSFGQALHCSLQAYKAVSGITAEDTGGAVALTWQGESGQELRAEFGIRDGQPIVQELAAREAGGRWIVLGKDLTPEFQVTTGKRRISTEFAGALRGTGVDTPAEEDA